jgi:pimeloyl-ACP methyl ester carboxylesterase
VTTKRRTNIVLAGILAALAAAAPCVWAYEIGHTTLEFSDPARGNRAVPTEVYYPADVPGEDVPVATPPVGGFQVVAFGHGFLISVDDYDFVWEGLVPAGYLVALPRTETGIQPSHLDLGLDLAFALRSLQSEGADPQSPFYAAVSAACAVGGHSMGGGASFLAAASDPFVTALFNFAAAETSPSAIEAAGQIAAPALLFAGSHDCVTPPAQHQQPMYAALASDCRTYAELIGASHCQFAEYNFLCALGESGCPPPTISRTQQHELTLALLRPWLDHFLKGDLQAWNDFQALLFGHAGITCLQDCAASAVGERADAAASEMRAQGPRLELTAGGIGSAGVTVALLMPAPAEVSLTIYDVAGRPVRALAHQRLGAGRHELAWDGTADNGRRAATGCYYCRLDSHPTTAALHVLILR